MCFKYLNNGNVVKSKKSKLTGIDKRKNILFNYDKKLNDLFELIENKTFRKDVARDDIADAICLLLVNKLGVRGRLSFIEDENSIDENGIEIKIAFYKP